MKMLKVFLLIFLTLLLFSAFLQARSPWTGRDKPMHLLSSAYLVYWNYNLSSEVLDLSHTDSIYFSVSLTSIVGIGKELSDKYIKGTRFCWYDMAYNTAGIVLGLIVIQTIH